MRYKLAALVFSFLIANFSFAQKSKTIVQVGETAVSQEEFKYVYDKNNSKKDSAYTQASLEAYLDLYVKFRLKVEEAENRKLDTSQVFINEFEGYKKQLAAPYFIDKQLVDSLTHQAYGRMTEEVRASHLLIQVAPDAKPADTLAAYNKLIGIRNEIVAGKSFADAAVEYSEDPSARGTAGQRGAKGDLGYFSAFAMVYKFEEAAFSTPVGQVSMPFRTRFGYHLVYVTDRRPAEGEIQVAHIMVKAADDISLEDSLLAKNKIDEVYAALQKGQSWAELCVNYSDHAQTKNREGVLKPFKRGGELGVPEFEKVAFDIKTEGEYSKPFKTSYGWHIVKLVSKNDIPTYQEAEPELRRKVAKDARGSMSRNAVIRRLKEENGYKISASLNEKVFALPDSTLLIGEWKYDTTAKINSKTILKIGKEKTSVREFLEYVNIYQGTVAVNDTRTVMRQLFTDFSNNKVIDYEQAHLSEKYLDYRMLVKEYKEGMLLFDLMEKEVWSKAASDTVGLQQFYEAHQADYQWAKRAQCYVFTCANDSLALLVKNNLQAGFSADSILKMHNASALGSVKYREQLVELKDDALLTEQEMVAGKNYIKTDLGKWKVVQVLEVLPPGQKQLNETRGLVISNYQAALEKEWLEVLVQKYPVVIYDSVLLELVKK